MHRDRTRPLSGAVAWIVAWGLLPPGPGGAAGQAAPPYR